jgi:transcriptional regulator with XRE-family HTH domain
MRKKVPLRMAALAGIARRELGLTAYEAARVFGKDIATISNFEGCIYAPSDETVRKILRHYIDELQRGVVPLPENNGAASLDELVEKLGVVLLLRMSARLSELVAAVQNGGLDQALDFVIAQGLRADVINSKFAKRLRTAIYQQRHREKREAEERAEAVAHSV